MTAMIFLERTTVAADGTPVVEIAAIEHEQRIARYEARGFRRCSYAEFRAAWHRRDILCLKQRLGGWSDAITPQHEIEHGGVVQQSRAYPEVV
jgi:hypothetical protein